jgi:hypothetical protein
VHHVELAEVASRFLDGSSNTCLVAHVDGSKANRSPGLRHLGDESFTGGAIHVADRHVRALARKCPCARSADAGSPSGD